MRYGTKDCVILSLGANPGCQKILDDSRHQHLIPSWQDIPVLESVKAALKWAYLSAVWRELCYHVISETCPETPDSVLKERESLCSLKSPVSTPSERIFSAAGNIVTPSILSETTEGEHVSSPSAQPGDDNPGLNHLILCANIKEYFVFIYFTMLYVFVPFLWQISFIILYDLGCVSLWFVWIFVHLHKYVA